MKKRPIAAIVNVTLGGQANLFDDTVAKQYSIVKDANKTRLLGPFPYGKTVRLDIIDPTAEKVQIVSIDADVAGVKETITANTRYGLELNNLNNTYESQAQGPTKVAYTTPSVLSGNADTDRANVYRALIDKLNAYKGANATASEVLVIDYTLGGAVGNDAPVIGGTITQTTSGVTGKILKTTITGGAFAAGTAAGKMWICNLSDVAATLLTPAKTWTYGAGNSTLTQTNNTGVKGTGIAIVDNTGYYTSNLQRGGASFVGLTQGFKTVAPVLDQAHVYAIGIGADMLAQTPQFNPEKTDAIFGNLEYLFEEGTLPDPAKTYTKFVITYLTGDERALDGVSQAQESQNIFYLDNAAADLAQLKLDLATAAAK